MAEQDWNEKTAWMRRVGATSATFDASTGALVSVALGPDPALSARTDEAQHDTSSPATAPTALPVSRAVAHLVPRVARELGA